MATTKKAACAGCTTANATIARQCGELKAMAQRCEEADARYCKERSQREETLNRAEAARVRSAELEHKFRVYAGEALQETQARIVANERIKALEGAERNLVVENTSLESRIRDYQRDQDAIHTICAEAGVAKARTMTTVASVKALAEDVKRARIGITLTCATAKPFCADLAIAELTAERDALKRECESLKTQRDGVAACLSLHDMRVTFVTGGGWRIMSEPSHVSPAAPSFHDINGMMAVSALVTSIAWALALWALT